MEICILKDNFPRMADYEHDSADDDDEGDDDEGDNAVFGRRLIWPQHGLVSESPVYLSGVGNQGAFWDLKPWRIALWPPKRQHRGPVVTDVITGKNRIQQFHFPSHLVCK